MKRMSQAFNNCLTHIKKEEELYMYQKKRKSLITMILTLTLVMGCLTGCGSGGSKGDGQSADAGGSDKKPVTLEIIRWGGGLPAQDDDIIKELSELDISNMTPMDALNTLYRFQGKVKNRWK